MFDRLRSLESPLPDFNAESLTHALFSDDRERKGAIGSLVNRLVTSATLIKTDNDFECPLLQYQVALGDAEKHLLNA